MKHLIMIMLLFGAVQLSAQTSIVYEYDEAGNRVLRKPLTVIPPTQSPLRSISVYPNPTIGIVNLEADIDFEGEARYEVYAASGTLLTSGNFNGSGTQLDLQAMPQGEYTITLYYEDKQESWKVIKHH